MGLTRILRAGLVVSVAVPAILFGEQRPAATGDPAVDSAAVARAAWGRANAAARANDVAVARNAAGEATHAWPTQEAYVWGSAVLAAQAGDTAGALRALTEYAALGLGRDVRAHPAFGALGAFAALPGFGEMIGWHDRNRAPLVNGHARTVIADTLFWPEGFDVDTLSGKYYIASVR